MLAPMEKFTDPSFRSICHKYGADVTFTELIRFETLARKKKGAIKRTILMDDTPTYIQFMGTKEEKLKAYLSDFDPQKGFLGFNFNLGCPSMNYVNSGVGCRMIQRPAKTKRLVQIVRDYGYAVNVKMRLGMTKQDKLDKIYVKLIEKVDADFFIVHARYRSQSYQEQPDWSVFKHCVETGKTIIANGDIKTAKDVKFMKNIGCAGVMIGREALINPLIFAELKNMKNLPSINDVRNEYLNLVKNKELNYSSRLLSITKEDLPYLKG